MPPIKSFGERIADALVEDGLLTLEQVQELLEQQKKEGTRLLKLILEKAYVSEQDMAVSMGRVLNTPPINLSRLMIPPEVAELVPREMARNHKVIPVSRLENKLFLAMADPSTSWPWTTSAASPASKSRRSSPPKRPSLTSSTTLTPPRAGAWRTSSPTPG
jgi:hypothetical protein